MIKTIEIAPYMFVDRLVDLVDDEVWRSIVPYASDDQGLRVDIDRKKLREAFLKVLLAGSS